MRIRTVRAEIAEAPIEPEPRVADEDESLTEATLIEPRSGPEIEERAYEEAVIEGHAEPEPVADRSEAAESAIYANAQFDIERHDAEDWREPPVAEA